MNVLSANNPMDLQREQISKPMWRKYWLVFPAILLLIATFTFKHWFGNASYVVAHNELITATVKQGDFRVNIRANGVLKPLNIRWVSSQVAGRVEQILVKAGSAVKKGDVLVILSDPNLHRELAKAQWQVKATQAENNAALVALEAQMVDLNNAVEAANINYQVVKLKLDAQTLLLKQGNATVSAIEYQKSQLSVKQELQQWHALQQKAKKMQQNVEATAQAQQARLALVDNAYQGMRAQVDALEVKASTSGVVQAMPVILGQRAQVGDSVALIADQKLLYAQLDVEEMKVGNIRLGQAVLLDTRNNIINGEISRIDPSVNNGMVQVDVKIVSALPDEARPDLALDGLIEVNHIKNALYVKRPAFAPKNTMANLFKLSDDQHFAIKQNVQLGASSVTQIQIIKGLKLGDEIILSDTSKWQEHNKIMLN